MSRRKRIALYGGTFDPVHNGHLALGRRLVELFELDEVIFVPAHVAPHKRSRQVTAAAHRFAMLALATQDEPRFSVSTVEIDACESVYTVDTITSFIETLGNSVQLFFVMGADSWQEIPTWREWERVLTMTNVIVVTRPGYELSDSHISPRVRERVVDVRGMSAAAIGELLGTSDKRIFLSDAIAMSLSATAVRRAVAEGTAGVTLSHMVPSSVAEYIHKYQLYR